jgi:hypothetical protein
MWACSLLLLLGACCGPDTIQKEKVVDTFVKVPPQELELTANPSTTYADTVKGNLTLRINKHGANQYRDTVQALNRHYRDRIRQLTEQTCPEIQDALLLETNLYQQRIQRLRDSLVTIRASVQQKADSIRVVKKQTVEEQAADDDGWDKWIVIGLLGIFSLIGLDTYRQMRKS